jgi:tetratricopeptide (TPR) repeat protein
LAKAAEKLQKKDMAQGDQVAEALRPLAEGLQENWRTIVPVAGVALALLLIVAIALQIQSIHRDKAAQSVGDALALVDRQVIPAGENPEDLGKAPAAKPDDKKAAAPDKTGKKPPDTKIDKKADAKPDKSKPAEEETYATEQEKQEAIAKKAQATVDAFGSQPAGRVAMLTLGDAQYRLGKFSEAVATYRKFIEATPDTVYLKAFGQVGLAWALYGANQGDEAVAAAKQLADHPPSGFGKDLGLLAQGKIAEDLGKLDDAKQAYRTLRTEGGESAAGREASERLTYLGEPPPPPTAPATPGGLEMPTGLSP